MHIIFDCATCVHLGACKGNSNYQSTAGLKARRGSAGLFSTAASTAYDALDEGQKQLLSSSISSDIALLLSMRFKH